MFLRTRLLSLALVVGIGFLLLVSRVFDAGLAALGSYLEASFSGASVILGILNSAAAFVVAVLLFAMIFKILPDVDLTWRDLGTGAVITGALFTLGKFLIGVYLGMSNVASSFGAAASIITILLWVYYSSLILLFGAEFTQVFAERHMAAWPREESRPMHGIADVPTRAGRRVDHHTRRDPISGSVSMIAKPTDTVTQSTFTDSSSGATKSRAHGHYCGATGWKP